MAPLAAPAPVGWRDVFDPAAGSYEPVPVYDRVDLPPGTVIPGPAVITEAQTSTVVSNRFDARIDAFGYIVLDRRQIASGGQP